MNNEKRNRLNDIKIKLTLLAKKLEEVMDSEQDSFDNLTEGLQATSRGAAMEDAIDNMSSALEAIEEAIDYIDDAMS